MITRFPEFKRLEMGDKEEIEKITQRFPPYSDFNFVSMWSWDIKGETRISMLNDNLVVRFTDYLTDEPFYSFLGDKEVDDTVKQLLDFAKSEGLKSELKLIPKEVIKNLDPNRFKALEDRDNFDYIFDLKYVADFSGPHFATKRNAISKLINRSREVKVEILDNTDPHTKFHIKKINIDWVEQKVKKDPYRDVKNELIAIDKFLEGGFSENIIIIGVFVDNVIKAYLIAETIQNGYAICHYIKADFTHKGIYEYIMRETAKLLLSKGIKFINFEQDLGLIGLKISKENFSTGLFLKKYKLALLL